MNTPESRWESAGIRHVVVVQIFEEHVVITRTSCDCISAAAGRFHRLVNYRAGKLYPLGNLSRWHFNRWHLNRAGTFDVADLSLANVADGRLCAGSLCAGKNLALANSRWQIMTISDVGDLNVILAQYAPYLYEFAVNI